MAYLDWFCIQFPGLVNTVLIRGLGYETVNLYSVNIFVMEEISNSE